VSFEQPLKAAILLMAAGTAAWQMWLFLPQHQQTLIKMRALDTARRAAGRAARWAAGNGIELELIGGPAHGAPWYSVAAASARIAWRAAAATSRARDAW
jgi:hypothetical protein